MLLNKTHIHEHVPGLISWNVGHEGKKGKAQCNLPGGTGYGSKERVPETVTAADVDGQLCLWAAGYAGNATWKRQTSCVQKYQQNLHKHCRSQQQTEASPQLSGMSKRRFKRLLGKRGRILYGKSLDILFLTDYLSMGNNEEIFTSS